jgi:hypothetical protein
MERNPQVLPAAFKKARAKLKKIEELNITPDMSEDSIDNLVITLSEIKALETETHINNFISGQQWYVQSLVDFSAMNAEERLNQEYDDCFPDIASEQEMLDMLG